MLVPFPRQPRLHQPRRSFRNDDLVVRRDVIAVGMGNERERLGIRRIEPDILFGQINAAFVSHFDHA